MREKICDLNLQKGFFARRIRQAQQQRRRDSMRGEGEEIEMAEIPPQGGPTDSSTDVPEINIDNNSRRRADRPTIQTISQVKRFDCNLNAHKNTQNILSPTQNYLKVAYYYLKQYLILS